MTMFSSTLKDNIRLAWDLARRDLGAKYRRSILGVLWLLLTPLCLLGVYSLVFGTIFGIEWKIPQLEHVESVGFALPFFVGLSLYLVLSDIVNTSSNLFASKRTYVLKSPFPLWVLWLANLQRGAVHAGASLTLVILLALIQQRLSLSGLAWSVISILSCGFFMGAVSLLLVSLGPFIGDISDALRLVLRLLFYATPITYPLTMVPQPYQDWMWLNPLTCMVELLRDPIVFGIAPSMTVLAVFSLVSLLIFCLAIFVFRRVKGVISDVV